MVLFILMAAGAALVKSGVINKTGTKQMTDVLLFLVTPMLIIHAFEVPFDPSMLKWLGVAAAGAIFTHIIGIILGICFFRKEPTDKQRIYRFAVIYSNSGFMALPLIQAVVGIRGVFYGAAYLVVFTVFVWTLGVYMMSGGRMPVKRLLLNPGILGTVVAVIVFFFSIKLPMPIHSVVSMLAGLNTPLAMIVIGAFLAGVCWDKTFFKKEIPIAALLRLLVIPGILFLILYPFNLPSELYVACMISASAPTAAITSLFAAKFGKDTELSGKLVAFSTLLSVVTMPLWVALAG